MQGYTLHLFLLLPWPGSPTYTCCILTPVLIPQTMRKKVCKDSPYLLTYSYPDHLFAPGRDPTHSLTPEWPSYSWYYSLPLIYTWPTFWLFLHILIDSYRTIKLYGGKGLFEIMWTWHCNWATGWMLFNRICLLVTPVDWVPAKEAVSLVHTCS